MIATDAAGVRMHGVLDVDHDIVVERATPTGDRDRIWETYEAHAAELHRYATARLQDSGAAEDIVQEAFLRLARESQARRYPGQPRAWLYRVVLNLIVSRARHSAVVRRRSAQEPFDDVILESPESRFLASERRRSLRIALEATGQDGRTGLILAAQGYSGREIAEVLGRTEAATRTLLCRARRDVRRELTSPAAPHLAM